MAVFRVEKNTNYTTMSNYHLRDINMSLKAIGLLSKILSLPEDWDYSIAGLAAICKEGESAIKTALEELKENGYLVVKKLNPDESGTGRYAYEYVVYESPQEVEKQGVELLPVEVLAVENRRQLNKDKQTKDKPKKEDKMPRAIRCEIEDYTKNEALRLALFEFVRMRKQMRRPLTEYGFSRVLKRMKNKTEQEQIKMLNQSIEKGWLTVYDVKTPYNEAKTDYKPAYSQDTISTLDNVFDSLKTAQNEAFGG